MLPFVLLSLMIVAFALLLTVGATRPNVRAYWFVQSANKALGTRHYDEALAHYDDADRMRVKIRDKKANNVFGFAIEHGRGICWLAKKQFARAETHLMSAAGLLEDGVEEPQRFVVSVHCELASACFCQGKTVEGEASVAKIEELCAATANIEIGEVAEVLVGAANGAASDNLFDLAFRHARLAVTMLQGTDAWHAGQLVETQISLASIHMVVGEYRRARELAEQAVASVDEAQFDEGLRETSSFLFGQLALIAVEFPAAIEYLQRSVAIREESHGQHHWFTGIARASLAAVYRAYGAYEQAEACFRDAYESQVEQLGLKDPIVISTAMQFALLLCDLGKHGEADRLLRNGESVPREVVQTDWNLLPLLHLVRGIWLLDQFQCDQAVSIVEESLRLAQANYGRSHILTVDYQAILGNALLQARRFDEAERALMETVRIRESAPDACQLDFADNLIMLANVFLATERPNDAKLAAQRAEAMIKDRLLPTNLTYAELYTVLAQACAQRGDHAEAASRLRQAEEIRLQAQSPNHPRLAGLYTAAALVYAAAGDHEMAERYRKQAAVIRAQFESLDSGCDSHDKG